MPFKKSVKKYGQKFVRATKKTIKNRYYNKASGFKLGQITKDILMLKKAINAEKKLFSITAQNSLLGQTNGATTAGLLAVDITPLPAQGVTALTRIGNSVKLVSSFLQFQIAHQSATSQSIKYKVMVVRCKGKPYTSATTAVNEYFYFNPFVLNGASSAIVDYNSATNPNFFNNFEVLHSANHVITQDDISAQPVISSFKVPLSYGNGRHVRFIADGTTTLAEGQILLWILPDSGNSSAATPTTLTGVPVTAVSTGLTCSYNITHYFYDN